MNSRSIEEAEQTHELSDTLQSNKLLLFLRVLCFILCLYGFLYQGTTFLNFYWSYPTIIEHGIESPVGFVAPALKYCYVHKISPNLFCKHYPHVCHKLEKNDTECEAYPIYCKENIEIPHWVDFRNVSDIYLDDLKNLNMDIRNSLYGESWLLSIKDIEGPEYYAPWWSINVFPCFTSHSRVDSNKDPIETRQDISASAIDPSNRLFAGYIRFDFRDNEMFDPKTFEGVAVQLHSPFDHTIPDMKMILKPGNKYEMEIKMSRMDLLPHPYKTNCINYTMLWEKNNRTGPRSQRMCGERCLLDVELACFNCVDIWNTYPHSKKKCIKGIKQDIDNICSKALTKKRDECLSLCKRGCIQLEYEFVITEKMHDPWDYRGYYQEIIEIDIYVHPDVLISSHRPKYQDVELFSNLGGYLGIWLGISLFTLADVIKLILMVVKPCLLKRRSRS